MKITVRQLRKLIREEVESAVGVPASGGVYQVGNWEPEVDEMLVFKTGSKAECEAAAVIMSELLKTQVITPEQLDEEDALFEYANASCVFLKDQPPRPVTDARIQIQSREDVLADPSVIAHHGAADLEEDDGGSVAAVLRDSSQKVGGIFFPHYNDETSFEPGEQAYLAGFVDAGPSSYYIIVSEDLSHFENWTAV